MIAYEHFRLAGMILMVTLLLACSKHPAAAGTVEQPAAQTGAEAPSTSKVGTVCDLVTAAEMAKLLGSPVTAKPKRLPSDCVYASVADGGPNAELKIDIGDGEAAMQGVTFANQFQPDLANPLAGLGDQATSAGPMVMIRRGDDLITIMVSGVEDALATVKRIYAAVDAKMKP